MILSNQIKNEMDLKKYKIESTFLLKMTKTCTLRSSDLPILRSFMLKTREIEMKSSYLRYSKIQLKFELYQIICEYEKFIQKFLMLYDSSEKSFLQKMFQFCKRDMVHMIEMKKMSFYFFRHVSNQYRFFAKYVG